MPRGVVSLALAVIGLALGPALAGVPGAWASCGAESCPLEPRPSRVGAGRLALDLSCQYVPQDHVRVGTRSGTAGQLPSPEDEVRTLSRITTLALQARLSRRWGASAALPFVSRDHRHVANEEAAAPLPMEWSFRGPGDLLVMADWLAPPPPGAAASLTLRAGLKLPTGRRHVGAVEGEQPEPPARPGTGSLDWLAGVHVMRMVGARGPGGGVHASLFASALGRRNGRGTEDYRVGNELQLAAGGSLPLAGPVSLLGQASARFAGKDEPGRTDALAANTGGTWIFASPGLRVAATERVAAYGYLHLPIYQRVNRIQLVAPWLLYAGVSYSLGR